MFLGCALTLFFLVSLHADEVSEPHSQHALQQAVLMLRSSLEIPNQVDIRIVEKNDRLVSITPDSTDKQRFQIAFEEAFLLSLTPEEILAAIAHELGHVWIFTHHPFLQTEALANRIAGKVISRGDLERIYLKSHIYLMAKMESSDANPEAGALGEGLGTPSDTASPIVLRQKDE